MLTLSMDAVMHNSPSRKRSVPDDDDISYESTPPKIQKTNSTPSKPTIDLVVTPTKTMTTLSVLSSPASTMSPPPLFNLPVANSSSNSSTTNDLNNAKKTKKTREEIERDKKQKEADREIKRLALEEKKRKREEEELRRNEERKLKAEELEEKKRKREEEANLRNEEKKKKADERADKQREKDAEKQKKVDEQEKKEKAQSRLHNFFAKNLLTPKSKGDCESSQKKIESPSPIKKSQRQYEGFFLPFNISSNSHLPVNYFEKFHNQPTHELDFNSDSPTLEEFLKLVQTTNKCHSNSSNVKKSYSKQTRPAIEIIDILQGTESIPLRITDDERHRYAVKLYNDTEWIYLHFHQDVRPAYWGTWTKPINSKQRHRLARNPSHRLEELFDYDYDSEAEWEEPEEGEELNSDDEEEEEELGDEEDAEFLDDETDERAMKRNMFTSDLIPICSGLKWENTNGNYEPDNQPRVDFSNLEMEFLVDTRCIDPYSESYWITPDTITNIKSKNSLQTSTSRPALIDKTKQINGQLVNVSSTTKSARLIPSDQLDLFKAAIEGQEMTKIGMVEHLKKTFPKLQKDAIANSLNAVAERESKKPNAKWRLKAV